MEQATRLVPTLTSAGASRALAAAEQYARARGLKLSIAVVDAAGHALAFVRLDGAPPLGVAASINKARTAAELGAPTAVFQEMIDAGAPSLLAVDGLTAARGGVPIRIDGAVVGAIAASGESGEDDEEVARQGAAALT